MIGKLTGVVEEVLESNIILNVNNVGYNVYCTSNYIAKVAMQEELKLWIETVVKENAVMLFGFSNLAEKLTFQSLISISGVGPKVALNILSKVSPSILKASICAKDKSVFASVQGIGTRLAERIILEMQSKLRFIDSSTDSFDVDFNLKNSVVFNDSINGLISLGLGYNEAFEYVNIAMKNFKDVGSIITEALKLKSKR